LVDDDNRQNFFHDVSFRRGSHYRPCISCERKT
jgi:hypothetical protein